MNNNFLLIDVELPRPDGDGVQFHSRMATHHPIGLLYLAAHAKAEFPDLNFKIFHTVTSVDPEGEIRDILNSFEPGVVGLRAMSHFKPQFDNLARLVRKHRPETMIFGGGPYPSASYEDLLAERIIDIAIINEGERTFNQLIQRLGDHWSLPADVHGTAVLEGEAVKLNPPQAVIEDLDTLEFPDYSLLDMNGYAGIFSQSHQEVSQSAFICATRGCPFLCKYCHLAFGKKIRRRSPDNIIAEMEVHYSSRGMRDFVFVDDIFNSPIRETKELLSLIIKRLPDITLNFPNGLRADILDEEALDLFAEAGTVHMALAVETASARLQKLIGKSLNIERARAMIDYASRRFVVRGFFMTGFPTETLEEAMGTIEFAKEMTFMAAPQLAILRIYPGTYYYDLLDPSEEEARLISDQAIASANPTLFGNPTFYGDIFSRDRVPLTGEDVQQIRWAWQREVVQNPDRISDSHQILERHYDKDHILNFYKNFFEKPNFTERTLNSLLASAAEDKTFENSSSFSYGSRPPPIAGGGGAGMGKSEILVPGVPAE